MRSSGCSLASAFLSLLGTLSATVLWSKDKPSATFQVEVVQNVVYYEGKDADPDRHKLDLYLPKGKKGFPVLLFVHGGGWKNGNKGEFAFLGKALASHGVGVACIIRDDGAAEVSLSVPSMVDPPALGYNLP